MSPPPRTPTLRLSRLPPDVPSLHPPSAAPVPSSLSPRGEVPRDDAAGPTSPQEPHRGLLDVHGPDVPLRSSTYLRRLLPPRLGLNRRPDRPHSPLEVRKKGTLTGPHPQLRDSNDHTMERHTETRPTEGRDPRSNTHVRRTKDFREEIERPFTGSRGLVPDLSPVPPRDQKGRCPVPAATPPPPLSTPGPPTCQGRLPERNWGPSTKLGSHDRQPSFSRNTGT